MSTEHGRPSQPGQPDRPRTIRAGPPGRKDTGPHRRGVRVGSGNRQLQDLSWLVTGFTERVPDVEHAAVVSSDGVPLAVSDGIPDDRLEHLSAVTSGLISLARGTAQMLDTGAVTQTLVAMEQGVLVVVAISDGSSLAVLAVIDADLDLVAYEMTVLAEQAGSVLTPDARPPPKAAGERA